MTKIQMPEFPDIASTDDWDSVIECINTYAEAYAAAKVREALEQAARACETCDDGWAFAAHDAGVRSATRITAAQAIRALIP